MSKQKQPSKIYAYVLVGVAMLFYLYEIFLQVSPSVMMQELSREFHVDAFAFGNMAATYFYIYTLMQIPVGVLYDRFGVRWIIIFALGICVLGSLFFSLASHFYVLYTARFLMGMGSAFALIGVLKIAANYLPKNQLSFLIGAAMTLGTIGAMLGNLVLTHLVNSVNWRHAMQITFAAGVVILVALMLCLTRFHSIKTQQIRHKSLSPLLRHLWGIAKQPEMWINAIVALFTYVPVGVFAVLWSVPYLKQGLGFSSATASVINSMLFLGYGLGCPIVGAVSDWIRRRKIFLTVSTVIGAIALALVIYTSNQSAVMTGVLYFIIGACVASETLSFTISKELSPPRIVATAFAFTNLICCIGISLLQPTVGAVLERYWTGGFSKLGTHLYTHHSFAIALTFLPVCYCLAFILLFWLPETGKTSFNKL